MCTDHAPMLLAQSPVTAERTAIAGAVKPRFSCCSTIALRYCGPICGADIGTHYSSLAGAGPHMTGGTHAY